MQSLAGWDLSIFRQIHLGWHSSWADVLFWVLATSGQAEFQFGLALILLFWKKQRAYVWPLILTVALTGTILAQGMKAIFPRFRPSNLVWALPQEAWKESSFPSGHTTTAFAVATTASLIAYRRKQWWVIPVSFLWAIGVGLSRIYRGVHWPTDVLGGICAGVLGGCLLDIAVQKWMTPKDETQPKSSASQN